MSNSTNAMTRTRTPRRALALAAGGVVSIAAAQAAVAVTEERFFLRWNDWAAIGVLGSDVVIGNFDGAQPNVNHLSFAGAQITQIAYPLPTSTPDRLQFVTQHATAALGAIGARNPSIGISPMGGIIGFAPQSRLIAGNFASGFDPQSGAFTGLTNESIFFALLAMTDQDFADAVAPHLGLPRYRVATVVNSSFGGAQGSGQRAGEDPVALIHNLVANMSNATLVASAGNEGRNQFLEQLNPNQGFMASPGSAHNTIAVGHTESGLQGQQVQESSRGRAASSDWRVLLSLLDPDAEYPMESPRPTEPIVFSTRGGVELVAPGIDLELPGSPLFDPLNNTASIKAWSGSSFSSAMAAGAVGLLHDLHRKLFFADPANAGADEFDTAAVLPPLVTRAILYNSARKIGGWTNGGQAGEAEEALAIITSTPFDQRFGAGRLDMRRLLNQYLSTPDLGGYRDIKPGDGLVLAMRRDPTISDPDDPRLTSLNTYVQFAESPNVPLMVEGTDPTIALINGFLDPDAEGVPLRSQMQAPRHTKAGAVAPVAPTASPKRERTLEAIIEANELRVGPTQLERPGGDPDLGSPSGGGLGPGGTQENPGSSGGGSESPGGGGDGGGGGGFGEFFFSSGWDHGMIGKGFLDLPLGIVSEGSTISVTLTWRRRQVLDPRVVDAFVAAVAPVNRSVVDSMYLDDPRVRHQLRHSIERPREEGGDVDVPFYYKGVEGLDTAEELEGAKPSMMAGVTVTEPGGPVPIIESDSPSQRVDPNVPTSPLLGVAAMRLGTGPDAVIFTGVAIGPRHILTAAHPFDPSNLGLLSRGDLSVFFNGVGEPDGLLRFDPQEIESIKAAPGYVGIDVSPANQFIGFRNDLAVVTLRPNDRFGNPIDLQAAGIPDHWTTRLAIAPGSPEVMVLAGYGESGTGDTGFTVPASTDLKRVGFNELGPGQFFSKGGNAVDLFEYDFDPPASEFGDPFGLYGGGSLGNRLETLHGEGDSGGPIFRWFDLNTDGVLDPGELRLFGINTYRRIGAAAQIGEFGSVGGGQILTIHQDFISSVLDPETPPVDPTIRASVAIDPTTGLIEDMIGFDHQKLLLEVWRKTFDGGGFALAGRSEAEWEINQLVFLNDPEVVSFGDYFIRITYDGTFWDLGGFRFVGIPSIPFINSRGVPYTNHFDGDVEYAIAWYVDLIRDPNVFPFRSEGGRSAMRTASQWMGDMNLDAAICGKDLGELLMLWGTTGEPGKLRGDLNGDGVVDAGDLGVLLTNWTGPRIPFEK